MIADVWRTLQAEPRVPDPPRRVWSDWFLVAVIVVGTLAEGIFRPDVVWRPVAIAFALVLIPAVWNRRAHPLAAVLVAFGTSSVLNVAAMLAGVAPFGLYTTAVVLVLPYAAARWGSGTDRAIGTAVTILAWLTAIIADWTTVGEAIGGLVFALFPIVAGRAVRYQQVARARAIEEVKLREREELARELHDTVAHHVSAIAIQAQAGRTLAAGRPEAAVDALEVIEEAASRTLEELRAMVGSLRRPGEAAALAPQAGVADLDRLTGAGHDRVAVDVQRAGDLADLRPAVDAAVFRIAQESITNAVRHARGATRVTVRVEGDHDCVRLSVSDDGEPATSVADGAGFGLVGMAERAAMLGGTLDAGPGPRRGWTVNAVLPRHGVPA